MENLYFYPTLTEELQDQAGFNISPYSFSYYINNELKDLKAKGKNTVKLEDSWGALEIEQGGLHIKREVVIEYPEVLYGKKGIACKGAKLGLSIVWTNHTLTQMGTILPVAEFNSGAVLHVLFEYDFNPGEIQGDLKLETMIYIKESAEEIGNDELHLMNEAGVKVGILDECRLDFGSAYMDFPIQEKNDKDEPLWWLDMGTWTDPRQDQFNEDNLRLYLNTAYANCPKVGETIKNVDVLVDIIATAYTMIFQRISEMGYLAQTINDVDLEPGSISKIMFYFWSACDTPIDISSIDRMHKTIWKNVEVMINGGDDQ